MKRSRLFVAIGFLISIIMVLVSPFPVHAIRGIPGSPEFGIGARVAPNVENFADAMTLVSQIRPDWLAVDLDWAVINPEPGVENWDQIEWALKSVHDLGSAVMVTLTNPPDWAKTDTGPDPAMTANFVSRMAKQYQAYINAIELFPAPNTRSGWGSSPNPSDYFNVFHLVSQSLADQGSITVLVAGGLEVNVAPGDPDAMKDVEFLKGLYAVGANTAMPIIGLRYSNVNGLPSAYSSRKQENVLRHYEDIRRLMTSSGHVSGIIWITYLGFPPGTSTIDQTEWLSEAYGQISTQLYIGVAFLQGINTCPAASQGCSEVSLITSDGKGHPFSPVLRGILARNVAPSVDNWPGRAKSELFRKNR